ncbi:hypothetical protein [Viridibacterium curvum]|uniref:Uncharacterized protein n=1 Tax=Viridibacterium curvum TaxID=1101404 RepID=A0ABP9R5D5_9RHOO
MHPIHDADALLLLALTLASKRRPANVEEIAIALGTLQPRLPAEPKLLDAFARLSNHGLVIASLDGYALSDTAQGLLKGVKAKGEIAERLQSLKDRLAGNQLTATHPASKPDAAALSAAIAAWRATLPPPTKAEKVAEQREARFNETNAKRIAEGKPPLPPKRPGPKRPFAARKTAGKPPRKQER